MEASIILRGKAKSKEHANTVRLMLSDDPPIFEEDIGSEWQFVFHALENIPTPESSKKTGQYGVQCSWLVGGEFLDELAENAKCFSQAGLENLVGYYWADESEGFIKQHQSSIVPISNWQSLLQDSPVKGEPGTDKWIDSALSCLSKSS
jgi:hypothetical protein